MDEWGQIASQYFRLGSPFRPAAADIAAYRSAIAGREARVMQCGVTPELAAIGDSLTAVDLSVAMIARVWPGDGAQRRAIIGDWLALPFGDRSFSAVVGDGSINAVARAAPLFLSELRRVLADDGVGAFRCFNAPPVAEGLEDIRDDAVTSGNFHALKMRVTHAVAATRADRYLEVFEVRDAFDRLFPDRDRLSRDTGWPRPVIDTIDIYAGSRRGVCYQTAAAMEEMVASVFPRTRFERGQGYPLAERCAIIVFSG